MGFFDTLSRSWEFSKISYSILWDHKQLLVFPIVSTLAAGIVTASFLLPMWGMGTIEQWLAMFEDEGTAASGNIAMWVTLFFFYFCNYFVIVFFNSGLTACAMKVIAGETPTVGYGMSMAAKRLPQIFMWAWVSAIVGVALRAIENAHEKAGTIIAAILGSAWTALTYFVVPVIVMEGAQPLTAIKRSTGTLRETWGTALVGNFSMGMLGFLVTLPFLLVAAGVAYLGFQSGALPLIVAGIAVGVGLMVIAAAATSAADVIFKAVLYNYATGKMIPAEVGQADLGSAFRERRGR